MSLVTIFILAVGLSVDAFSVAIGIGATNTHGHEPQKRNLKIDSATSRDVSYPPCGGIVQLANSYMLRFRNWSFTNNKSWAPVLRLAAAFGIFQYVMPIIGWLAGLTVVEIISAFDHWIAFGLLAVIGGKMIWEGFEKEIDEEKADQTKGMPLLMLSVATSIDALAVGFSFSVLNPYYFPRS
jgi:putative Mn2+ efflux pump MntP